MKFLDMSELLNPISSFLEVKVEIKEVMGLGPNHSFCYQEAGPI